MADPSSYEERDIEVIEPTWNVVTKKVISNGTAPSCVACSRFSNSRGRTKKRASEGKNKGGAGGETKAVFTLSLNIISLITNETCFTIRPRHLLSDGLKQATS